jgi:hypothetical protein
MRSDIDTRNNGPCKFSRFGVTQNVILALTTIDAVESVVCVLEDMNRTDVIAQVCTTKAIRPDMHT